jgi:DNA-binding NtrC family response regulator
MPERQNPSRIFVVDDESIIATTLATILKANGFHASAFTRPEDALTAAQISAPDLLISDVLMPGISGISLAIQMQKENPACKILLFSGQAATADLLDDARSQGHDFEVLAKPIHPKDLLMKINSVASASAA